MKCTNRKKSLFALFTVFSLFLSACGFNSYQYKYDIYETSAELNLITASSDNITLFSDGICKPEQDNFGLDNVADIDHVSSAAVFDITDKKTLLNDNMLERIYPASTTKILTALTAFMYGDLDKKVVVSENAVNQIKGSSLCKVAVGDELSLRQLLYGLILPSGNDAAVAIAEGVSGTEEDFVKLMNETAYSLGATHSHFVNPSGLHDDDHYTTAYDMYLITSEAMKYDELVQILGTSGYDAYFRDANGQPKSMTWHTTDLFLNGQKKLNEGFSFVGGKTGTTGEAKYCLVLITNAPNGHQIISIVYHADNQYNLYLLQTEILGIVQ